ncbi:hypothetical protein BSR29_03330 [Boudabousia liubingyangii]|uniref:ABC transporter domain-containing protein n=1 Tax=Boudabousia liubingyangii TaxID=1921764 RepID=A0A1Q5PMW7_9ACTO|nr:metal ABC transporter ATP-binding protein [Boudabousia liubingyangii]OKL48894.1 hypothetical protein BSR29_03330 [Boudabousia liubingyangii]
MIQKSSDSARRAPLVSARSVSASYETTQILKDISFDLHESEVLAILGPNGCGKSTLLKVLLGILAKDHGQVTYFGDQKWRPRTAKQVGYVPQRLTQGAGISATALEVVESGLAGPGLWGQRGRRTRALAALEQVGMAEHYHRPVTKLSGGQHQRVLIARALVREPKLLVMDEPLAGIDSASAHQLAQILEKQKAAGTGIILVLHDLGCLESIIDQLLILEAGQVVEYGPLADFADRKQQITAHAHALCGETEASHLPGGHL